MIHCVEQEHRNELDTDLIRRMNLPNRVSKSVDLTVKAVQDIVVRGKNCMKWLRPYNAVVTVLQKDGLTLAKADAILEDFEEKIKRHKEEGPHKALYHCPLKMTRSSVNSTVHSTNKAFETGVIKIQNGQYSLLTDAEKKAGEKLKKCNIKRAGRDEPPDSPNSEGFQDGDDEGGVGVTRSPESPGLNEVLDRYDAKLAELAADQDPYEPCDNIVASAACIERVWNHGRNILRYYRQSLSPHMFETILFLKMNAEIWNSPETMQLAINQATKNRSSEKTKKILELEKKMKQLCLSLVDEDMDADDN